jgi:glycosyltransferase involved in cell wall biosynthesis
MAKVQSASPHMELVVIGDGPLRAELEEVARKALCRCRFLGFQSADVVRHWMNRARIFGAPSVRAQSGDAEGYPNAFAEAQAMGLPVVSFSSDGVREAVTHGQTGFLASERDTEGLAHYLQKLCADEVLCARMGNAARTHVREHFNLRTQSRKLEELYMRVLGKEANRLTRSGQMETEPSEPVAALDAQG